MMEVLSRPAAVRGEGVRPPVPGRARFRVRWWMVTWRRPLALVLAVSAVVLSACVSLPASMGEAAMFFRDYIGPVGQPGAALMRVTADGAVRVTPSSTCADFTKPETGVALFSAPSTKDYRYLHGRQLGVKGEAPPGMTSTEIALAGGAPVVVSFTRTWAQRGTAFTCQMHRSFVPEPGAHYQLLAQPLFNEGQCGVLITRLTAPAGVVPAVPTAVCGSAR